CNYLLHIDARARFEGLDLWYRVQRFFPGAAPGKQGDRARADERGYGRGVWAVIVPLLLSPALLLSLSPCLAQAADAGRLETVRQVRKGVTDIRREVQEADPYHGSDALERRLVALARQLDRRGSPSQGADRWFYQAIEGFGQRSKEGALAVLDQLDDQLGLIEDSLAPGPANDSDPAATKRAPTPEEIKALAARSTGKTPGTSPATRRQTPQEPRPARDDEEDGFGPRPQKRPGGGMISPQAGAGFSGLGWVVLFG